ncbi:uncharacterized protein EV154DRAFT_491488 [Mucor mucedo]|uniref:uncharacterized protein n=1 Tax=Mucor mucedo TaxID=29922 RepID=UPI00221FECFD|nr:uncharacterized protein EV154DRAFT_491488 [Mucor mucedo]KAI7896574.1 hypothetical protein EV154DRAFT_491488 [Mucor mucedo]
MANTQLPADLEVFVSKEVASLCDADPTVLAQYIIALIGNEDLDDRLKSSLEEKLHEFFDDQTMPFINRLFSKINGQSASATTTNTTTAAATAVVPSLPPTTDRFNDFSDDEDDGDRNFKHRRQRSESQEDGDRGSKRRMNDDPSSSLGSKYYRTNTSSNDERRPNPNNIPVTGGFNGHHFDNNNRARGGSGTGGNMGRPGVNPRMHNMNRGQNRPQCRDYNEKGFCMRGDMCPYDHGMDRIIVDEGAGAYPGPFPPGGPIPPMGVRTVPPQPFYGMPDAYDPERSGMMPGQDMGFPGGMMPNNNDMMNMRGNGMRRGGRGHRGNARGGYNGRQHYNQHNAQNTTLNVEKIPVEFCQIATVNEFFAKFGTITNISVQPHAQKAVIQYSTRQEAENAYNSPDAIFDNRFVKVYWHKDETPAVNANGTNTAATATAPVEPQPPMINPNEPDPELVAARAAELAKEREEKQKKHQEHMKSILELQKKRENQLQQQIDEQKRLLDQLTNSTGLSQLEKADLLKALKTIQSDINTTKTAATQPPVVPTASEGSEPAAGAAEGTETTEDLKKKLARLEAEASHLGIQGSGFRGGRGGYYGRGRGSWPRMRGGMTRMSLDNRPTKIVVKDIPQESNETELRQHFDQFGTVTSFEQKESEVVVQYGQRFEAERAMTAGPNYSKGTLQLAWISETPEEA